MKRTCGKTLTLTILAAILAGTVPAFAGDVIGQQVTVDKDRTESLLCGGYTTSGNALTNTLFVTGSASITSDEGAGGGYAENGEAIGNQVNFSSSGSHQIEAVFGGCGRTKASENQVSITNGKFDSQLIYGGLSESAADNNKVSIGGTADITLTTAGPGGDGIYGGCADGQSGTAKENQVIFNGGTVRGAQFIAGGEADNVVDNQISISDGKLENNMVMVGGYGSTRAQGNVVSVDEKADVPVLGLAGGYAKTAESNQVSIGQDASVTAIAVGGGAGETVSHNLADVRGTVTGYLLGAEALMMILGILLASLAMC